MSVMSKSGTVALVLGNAEGKIGAYDDMINATVEAKKGDKDSAIRQHLMLLVAGLLCSPVSIRTHWSKPLISF